MSRGCHQLIKDGARLVESIDDVLQELNLESKLTREPSEVNAFHAQERINELSPELRQVISLVQYEPTPYELIAAELSNLNEPIMKSPDALSTALIELELEGLITVTAGLYQRRIKPPS